MIHPQEVKLKEGLSPITLEHVSLVKQVMADAFLENNDVWKSFVMSREEI